MSEQAYSFDDVILTPQYSTLRSRAEADTSFKIWKYDRKVPIISANMETITGSDMAIKLWKLCAIGALHRFLPIEDNVAEYQRVVENDCDCIVSVGVNGDSQNRAIDLYNAGARMFVVDIAHGHSIMMKEMTEWLREQFGNEIFIIAGNIATREAASDLFKWGADCVKVGVGPGSVCTTRVITGHGVPTVTAIDEVRYLAKAQNKLLIADGGMRSSGDIVKALASGADCVMIGGMLSGTDEAPGEIDHISGKDYKIFKGSASYDRGPEVAKEGIAIMVPYKGAVESVITDLVAGIRSGMSYSNARTLQELRENAHFHIQTASGYTEGLPHMKFNK